ncbi:MAG: TolC family protein, partial [Planctomycetales bacterium]
MNRRRHCVGAVLCLAATALGCRPVLHENFASDLCNPKRMVKIKDAATSIDYPDAGADTLREVEHSLPPRTLRNPDFEEYWDLTLEEVMRVALKNSKVMRDLGGRVLTAPAAVSTVYQPAIQESDPRFGTEAALSAFDAQFTSSLIWEKNNRALNQRAFGNMPVLFDQDTATFQAEISKTAATGTRFFARNNTTYDKNNNVNNFFPSAWDTNMELGFQHPLLQGAGIEFNRIAGPNATPGFFFSNGVLIARVNNDVSLADFEAGVRQLVNDVENAYWDLYFAYRNLEARKAGRDQALKTWRYNFVHEEGRYDESLAKDQYFLVRGLVEDALSGQQGGSTQSGGGSSPGVFRGAGGVFARETNLRWIKGISPNDGRMIRTIDEPSVAAVEFDWQESLVEALCRRVELRRQRWIVKRREMELVASRNFLRPRLDTLG